ncbi:MAG: HAMP domain-containing histidine kinase [Ruminococcus sp.]|nr:HAMP domain-containing histidine kinase [Ruminococcus sp.]
MNSRRSIFSKYFMIVTAVILISFVCLGAVLLLVSSHYFLQEKKDMLEKNVLMVESNVKQKISSSPSDWKEDTEWTIKELSIGSGADILLCDRKGTIIANSGMTGEYDNVKLTREFLSQFGEEAQYVRDDFGGSYEMSHIVGKSFAVNGPLYYILAITPENDQDSSTNQILYIFIISMTIVFAVEVVVVYFIAVRLTAPIREVAEISKEIGEGNFSVKMQNYDTAEMQELSNAFNEMAASLKNYDTMRNSFIANVSHELRTPMTSIGGFVDGMLDGTIPPEKHEYYMRIISSEVDRLTRLVRSMLNLAKIESGEMKPNLSRFSVLEPIVDTLVTFEPRLAAKNIEVRGLDVDRMYLYADNDLVHQVMYNLIENAIKFVDEGGYIEFGFEPIGYMTVITIRNSGEGLDEDELPLVFDRFYKTDKSRGLDKTGVGLGLNIVRSIIRLHGGKIMVRSVKGEYTEFTFTLPNKLIED